jgi:hypothetical protein
MDDQNGREEMDETVARAIQQLRSLAHAPSVQMGAPSADSVLDLLMDAQAARRDNRDGDMRDIEEEEGRIEDDREFYDGDKDTDGDRTKRSDPSTDPR